MAVKAAMTTETFPSHAAIIAYINDHPSKSLIENPKVVQCTPDSVQKVANFFAKKQMARTDIQSSLRTLLADTNPERTNERKKALDELIQLEIGLSEVCQEWGKNDKNTTGSIGDHTIEMQRVLKMSQDAQKKVDETFEITVALYNQLLCDLLDKATFTKPPQGETKWTKHV